MRGFFREPLIMTLRHCCRPKDSNGNIPNKAYYLFKDVKIEKGGVSYYHPADQPPPEDAPTQCEHIRLQCYMSLCSSYNVLAVFPDCATAFPIGPKQRASFAANCTDQRHAEHDAIPILRAGTHSGRTR